MDVRKTIAELTSQLSEVNYDSEEDNVLLKDTHLDDFSHEDNDHEIVSSSLRKRNHVITLPEQVYGGKKTTRKKTFNSTQISDEEINDDLHSPSDEDIDHESEEEDSVASDAGSDEAYSSEDIDDENISESSPNPSKNATVDCSIYSTKSKNIPSDVKRGTAIRNQLRIWDSLLECRIKLQKALTACNNLPAAGGLLEVKSQLKSEEKLKFNKCKKNLLDLLDKMVNLQSNILNQSDEFKKANSLKLSETNEEIPSDESEIEEDIVEEENEDQPPLKKRKLLNYSSLIEDRHAKFIPLRNACIQKWNDKTKVSSGKMASSNFSAFDQSTLKQIEQIMADKVRLVNRTRIRRNNQTSKTQDISQNIQDVNLDAEIFDDTDFYHKLLRDYIERKSVDVTGSAQTERQMIELQKLRSKMKKNVDTKSTKGRKLRYVVLPKLVNFMAPDPYNTWSEEAETELYNSLFGKIKL